MRYNMRLLIKWYLKKMTKDQRRVRGCFLGKRLKALQKSWLSITDHPWEHHDHE